MADEMVAKQTIHILSVGCQGELRAGLGTDKKRSCGGDSYVSEATGNANVEEYDWGGCSTISSLGSDPYINKPCPSEAEEK